MQAPIRGRRTMPEVRRWPAALGVAIALLSAIAVATAVLAASGRSPSSALAALVSGAVGTPQAVQRSLAKATPLLFAGLAVAVGLRGGLFNIGVEGQLLAGGLAAAWVGFAMGGLPVWVHLPLAVAGGAAAGAAWAFVPGLLKAWRGAHEVIVTIMMNYVAAHLAHYLVSGPLKDTHTVASATPYVLPTARLWAIGDGGRLSFGFPIALVAAAGFALLFRRARLGLEIRAIGASPAAARTAGVPVARTIVVTMLLSGALAGLGGAVEILGVHHRFLVAFSPGYGFESIAVALLGGLSAVGVTLSAILFGALASGSAYMESWADTPRQIAGIVQAVAILSMGVCYLRRET